MPEFRGNKGEWSEIYVLFRILADGRLSSSTKDFQNSTESYFPVSRIIRKSSLITCTYEILEGYVEISSTIANQPAARVTQKRFRESADLLFGVIAESKGVFSVPELSELLSLCNISSIKAPSSSKEDIILRYYEPKVNQEIALAFSIKSELGAPPTLLNASQSTNVVFKIGGSLTNQEIVLLNKLPPKQLVSKLSEENHTIVYSRFNNPIFEQNLKVIDSQMPEIVAHLVLAYFKSSGTSILSLTDELVRSDPLLVVDETQKFYSHKIRTFLQDVALGLRPATSWSGVHDASGGYIVLLKSGNLCCIHSHDRELFRNYLESNTKLETADARNNFGTIFSDRYNSFISLNLQIRFIR
jgi:type II restriction enzyme